ncbi:MAG: hypothetical protein IJQ97_04465 [Paludibacteraceae bacterium]|nr:hypothetical protein [Paludibacteraceae bacterium]
MKNKIFLHVVLLTTCTFSCQLFAQIQVANTGNVGIAIADTIEPLSTVSIGSEGLEGAQLSVSGSGNPTGNQYGVVSQLDMKTCTM